MTSGNICVTSISPTIRILARNARREKAYPASAAMSTVTIEVVPATKTELRKYSGKSLAVSTKRKLSKVVAEGHIRTPSE